MSALTDGVCPDIPAVLTALGKGPGDTVKKNGTQTMEILEAFDKAEERAQRCELAGCDPKTVRRLVARRETGWAWTRRSSGPVWWTGTPT